MGVEGGRSPVRAADRRSRRTSVRLAVVSFAFAIAFMAAALPGPSAAAASSSLRRYPYLTDLVTNNVTVNWATTTSVMTGSVTYGQAGVESCTAHSVTATKVSITVASTAEYQWKALISGLAADTAYCYRVFGGSTDLLGSDPSPVFRSQIGAGATTPFAFAVLGDWGAVSSSGQNPDQANLMAR